MGLFEHFPYTNFHEVNLAWLIHEVKKLREDLDNIDPSVDLTEILERLTTLENAADLMASEVAALSQDMDTVEDAVSALSDLPGRVTALEALPARMTTTEGQISAQGSRLTTAEGKIATLESKVAALEAQTPAVAFLPVSGGIRVQMDNAGAVALADQNLGRPVEVTNSGTLTGGDASDAVAWIQAVLAAKAQGKIIQIYSPDYAYLTEVCYYKHSDSWIELNFSRPGFEDLTNHYDYDLGYFVDVNATDPANVDYKVTVSACALRFNT